MASVTIQVIVGDHGIWEQSKEAIEKNRIQTYLEQYRIIALAMKTEKLEKNGEVEIGEYLQKLKKDDPQITVQEEGNVGFIITKEQDLFEVNKDKNNEILINQKGSKEEYLPSIQIEKQIDPETKQVSIKVVAKEWLNGIQKIEQIGGETRQYETPIKEAKELFPLYQNGTYTYRVTSTTGKQKETTVVVTEVIELLSIMAEYKGVNPITENRTLNKEDFLVKANYANGSQKEITDFNLSKTEITGQDNGTFLLQIYYTESGITKQCEVELEVQIKIYLMKSKLGTTYNHTNYLKNFRGSGMGSVSNKGEYLQIQYVNNTAYGGDYYWYMDTAIDLSNYKKMYIKYRLYGNTSYVGNGRLELKIAPWTLLTKWFNVGGNVFSYDTGVKTSSYDISSWTNKTYTYEVILGGCGGTYNGLLYDIWLE